MAKAKFDAPVTSCLVLNGVTTQLANFYKTILKAY